MQTSTYKLFFTKIWTNSIRERVHVSKSYIGFLASCPKIIPLNNTIICDEPSGQVLIYHNLLTTDYFSKKHKL